MKAIQVRTYGHSDLVQLEDIPRPSPKVGEVLVRIRDAGVNPIDWKIREGYFKEMAPKSFPLTLGQDFSGEVIGVGRDVADFKIGDAVFGVARGAYAEYATVPSTMIAKMPNIDFTVAAALPTPALTAYQMVMKVIRPSKEQIILIQGAAGSVGSIATQLVLASGARVIATASSKDASYLKELGVDRVIDFKTERFEEKIKDVDAVIDLVGGDVLSRSLQVIRPGGRLVTTVGSFNEAEARQVQATHFVMSPNSTDLTEIAKLVDQGVLKTRVSQVLPLTQARQALDLSQSGHSHGKLILKVA
jgi:NADPH:quinone reductase-like Zn-dependent oxidoreductase